MDEYTTKKTEKMARKYPIYRYFIIFDSIVQQKLNRYKHTTLNGHQATDAGVYFAFSKISKQVRLERIIYQNRNNIE